MRRLTRGWEVLPVVASVAPVLIGLTALAGWILGLPVLTEWMPGFGAIKVDAAIALVLCGCGLVALRSGRHSVVWLCGAAAAALGLFDLARYAASRDLLTAASALAETGAIHWQGALGRMAPASALAFLFAAGTLLSASGAMPQKHKVSVLVILACAVIGVAVLGRLEAFSSLVAGIAPTEFRGMSTGTALGLAALGTGLLSVAIGLRPRESSAHPRAAAQQREDRSIHRLMVMQSVATGMLAALLGILAISQIQLRNTDAAARLGIEKMVNLQQADIELEYERRWANAAQSGRSLADLAREEIAAALAACPLVAKPSGGAGSRNVALESGPGAARLREGCASLRAAEARRSPAASPSLSAAGWTELHRLEDGLRQGINRLMRANLDAVPQRRAREASARQWQTTVLVACLIAGLGASVLQLGLLQQLSRQHSALAAEMVKRKEAEAQSRAYLEVAPAAILGVDHAGRITLVNSRALSAFGFHAAELLGQSVEILIPERDRARHSAALAGYLQAPEERQVGAGLELTARRKDGGEFPAEVRVSAIDSAGGKLVLASITDISQHKKAEEELRRAVRELEAFAHSVSHDLRRPLQIIVGYSELLVADHGEALGDDGQEYVQRILAAGGHMSELIESLLSLAKVSTGALIRTTVSLGAVAATVLDDLRSSEPGREVTLKMQPGLDMQGDPQLLRILLENLLGNAWKFTGKIPMPEIELGAFRHHGVTVYFVSDNGAGFDMAKAKDLFKAFHRLHESSDFPGTGIGLATVQRIVHRHGGRIWARSAPNEGATFCFTLEPVLDLQIETIAA